jgi:hypothetical protein
LVERAGELERLDRRGRVEHRAPLLVLLGAAEGPEESPQRHVAVDLLREAEPHRIAEPFLDPAPAHPQVLPAVRAVREADLGPQVDAVVPGVGHVGIGEREVFPGSGIERGLPREPDHRPVAPLDLANDVGVIDHLRGVGGRRRTKRKRSCPWPAAARPRPALISVGVMWSTITSVAVLLAPGPGEDAVEPAVVARNEVAPLQNPQRLAGRGAGPPLSPAAGERRERAGRREDSAGGPDELSTRNAFDRASL